MFDLNQYEFTECVTFYETAAEALMRSAEKSTAEPEQVRALVSLASVYSGIAWAFRDAAATSNADAIDELSNVVLSWVCGERVGPAADSPDLLAGDRGAN